MKRLSRFLPAALLTLLLLLGGGLLFLREHQVASRAPITAAESCEKYECEDGDDDTGDYLECIKDKQQCLRDRIKDTQKTAASLTSSISIINGQIQLQELEIAQTQAEIRTLEREIAQLAENIAGLEVSLDRLGSLLVSRVQASYKHTQVSPLEAALAADSMGEFITTQKYLRIAKGHVSRAMQQAEEQRLTYNQQKALKEDKQLEVEAKRGQLVAQQSQLDQSKQEKQRLLQDTRNDEARFRDELAKTQAELEAIQSIIAGRGDESEVGSVESGEEIASIIAGASTCSTGSHLHFEVVKDGSHRNPAGYLSSISASWNNGPDDSFGFSGNWDWPVDNPAKINQGYGMTYYASVRRAYGGAPHTGIDMFSKSPGDFSVRAVRDGTLYRGSIPCGGGLLRYVRVDHDDSDEMSTYYLHVNY